MTDVHLVLTDAVLADAASFLTDCGATGHEGTGLLAFRNNGKEIWTATRFFAPDQTGASVNDGGCWVQITPAGEQALAGALGPDEMFLARIHSHPAAAFHSATDDRNPILTHDGAVSIVVPFFGLGLRQGLTACAFYRRQGHRWVDLPAGPQREKWVTSHG